MGGGKGKSAPAPDYGPVAQANREAAEISRQIAADNLAWAKETYDKDSKVTQQFLDIMLPAMQGEAAAGAEQRERYKTTFQTMEDDLVREARDYASPQRQEFEAGRAQADVAQAFEAQRRGALATLESLGVDPSTARAGALDRAVRTAEAAATAGAANAARTQTENIGRGLRGEVVNLGKGYPGQIAQAYQTAQQSGGGAVQSNLATTASGAGTMGTGFQWTGAQQGFLSNWNQNLQGQGQIYATDQRAKSESASGFGAIAGSVLGLAGRTIAPGGIFNALPKP